MAITFYDRKCLNESIEIKKKFSDIYYGIIEPETVVLQFDNSDGYFSTLIQTEELRGKTITIYTYEPLDTPTKKFECIGRVSNVSFNNQGIVAEISVLIFGDPAIYSVLPVKTYETDDWTDNPPHVINPDTDLGKPYPIPFGYCKKVKALCVSKDYDNDYYDYIIGRTGSHAIVSNDANKDTTMTVYVGKVIRSDTSTFTVYDGSQVSPYPGYAFIRFAVEPRTPEGEPLDVWADFSGLATRNGVTILKTLLSDATIGLGQTVNAASFTTAEAIFNDLLFDFALTEQSTDHIIELLRLLRGGLQRNENNEIIIVSDTEQDTITSAFSLDGAEYPAIKNINSYSIGVDLQDAPKDIIINYRYNPWTDEYQLKQTKSLFSFGEAESLIIETDKIRDHATIDRIIQYEQKKRTLSEKEINLIVGMGGRNCSELELTHLEIDTLGIDSNWIIQEIAKGVNEFELTCRPYDENVYTYTASSLPPDEYPDDIPDYSATPPDPPTDFSIVSSGTTKGEDGILISYWQVQCTEPVANANFSHCVFGYKPASSSLPYLYFTAEDQSGGIWQGRIDGLSPGVHYDLVARSVNAFNLMSDSNPYLLDQISAGDSGVPAQVTGMTGKTSKGKTWEWVWDDMVSADKRITSYHVQVSTSSAFTVILEEKYNRSNKFTFSDANQAYGSLYARVKSRTRKGLESSAWSSTGTSTTSQVQTGDVGDSQITGPKTDSLDLDKVTAGVLYIGDGSVVHSSYGGDRFGTRDGQTYWYSTWGAEFMRIGQGVGGYVMECNADTIGISGLYIKSDNIALNVYSPYGEGGYFQTLGGRAIYSTSNGGIAGYFFDDQPGGTAIKAEATLGNALSIYGLIVLANQVWETGKTLRNFFRVFDTYTGGYVYIPVYV